MVKQERDTGRRRRSVEAEREIDVLERELEIGGGRERDCMC